MKKILIIGAGFLQDFVIKKAVSMGYETLVVDADSNAIGFSHADKYGVIDIIDENACLEFAKKEKVDGVLTAATDFGVLSTSFIAQEMGLPGLKYDVAKLIKNKSRVRKCLFDNYVDDTEQSFEIDSINKIIEIKDFISFPVMVKPCDGSGSRGASRVDNYEDLIKACKIAMRNSISHCAEIETFIEGNEYGAESIVINGEIHVLAIMKKWMTKPPFYAELGHAIPSGLSKDIEEKAKCYVKKAISALGINFGSVNMDLLITSEGKVHIIDIGARMGGNMIGPCVIPYGTGIDYMGAMIQNAVGDPVDLTAYNKNPVVTKLLAFKEGTIKSISNLDSIEKKYDVEIYHHMNIGMHVNEYHTNLDGCGYIIAKGSSVEIAETNAKEAFAELSRVCFEENK